MTLNCNIRASMFVWLQQAFSEYIVHKPISIVGAIVVNYSEIISFFKPLFPLYTVAHIGFLLQFMDPDYT